MSTPKIIWGGIKGETQELEEIFKKTEKAAQQAGIERETKPYFPHLTLGRISDYQPLETRILENINKNDLHTEPWLIEEIILMKSELLPSGPKYTKLGLFKI